MAGGSSKGPRYAPEDPTLPKPWRELIDGASGYHYYWNPETNVTQYERPVTESLPPPPPGPPPRVAVSSSVRSQHRDDGRRSGAAARSRSHQSSRAGTKGHGAAPADGGGGLTGDAYCRQHEITVTGDEAPAPFTTFESTSFPMEILKEVRYLLQGGANVVHCAAFYHPLWVDFTVDQFRKCFRVTGTRLGLHPVILMDFNMDFESPFHGCASLR